MSRRTIIAGLLGAVTLIVWTFVVDGVLGLRASIDMKRVAQEREVYEVLKQHVVEPGRYVVNPELTEERRFPGGEPVFSVLYGGVGHESAGRMALLGLVVFLAAPLIATWMLSQASGAVLASYRRRVMFFTAIGFLIASFADLSAFGIGGYPIGDALVLAGSHIASWTLVGAVVAWRLR